MVEPRSIQMVFLLMSCALLQTWSFHAVALPNKCEALFAAGANWTKFINEWNSPLAAQWPNWVRDWESEGHHPKDVERISKLVRRGEINEAEGRAIIEEANIDTLEYLAIREVITPAEYQTIVKAFLRIDVDSPLGQAEVIPTLSTSDQPSRRQSVLAQEFRGIASPETDRELVLSDIQTKRKLGTLTFFFEGYRHLAIAHMFVVKTEWTERYSELLFAEILRRYPSIQTVTFDVSSSDLRHLKENNVGARATRAELIRGTRAYQVARLFGFRDFQFQTQPGTEDEFGIRILATRPTPPDRR